jgi:hypothetical protein
MQTVVRIEDVQNIEATKKVLQEVLDRDWSNETLLQTATVAANGIHRRDEQIKELEMKRRIANLEAADRFKAPKFEWPKMDWGTETWHWQYNPTTFGGVNVYPLTTSSNTTKPLVFDKAAETPCTAEIEVAFEKLAAYFEKRAKENTRRSEKEENVADSSLSYQESVQADRSSYYFSGKADSYKRAAEKVREILGK